MRTNRMTKKIQTSDLLGKRIIAISWITDSVFVIRVEGDLKLACYTERGLLRIHASEGEAMEKVLEFADGA